MGEKVDLWDETFVTLDEGGVLQLKCDTGWCHTTVTKATQFHRNPEA
jgi:hypothetical protein